MVNENRIVMRNDLRGPPNRPLLRLSRSGGGGILFVPGNQLGYAHAVNPEGRTQPFLTNIQGNADVRSRVAVTSPIPVEHVRGDKLGFGFSESPYDPQQRERRQRTGFFANRGGAICPRCKRSL